MPQIISFYSLIFYSSIINRQLSDGSIIVSIINNIQMLQTQSFKNNKLKRINSHSYLLRQQSIKTEKKFKSNIATQIKQQPINVSEGQIQKQINRIKIIKQICPSNIYINTQLTTKNSQEYQTDSQSVKSDRDKVQDKPVINDEKKWKQLVTSQSMDQLLNTYRSIYKQKNKKTYTSEHIICNHYFQQIVRRSMQNNTISATNLLQALIDINWKEGFNKKWQDFKDKYLDKYRVEKFESYQDQVYKAYLKGSFCEDFSKPQVFIKMFVYLYSGEHIYRALNLSLKNYQFPLATDLVSFLLKGIRSLLGQNIYSPLDVNVLYRGVPLKLGTHTKEQSKNKSKKYFWSAFTSTSKQFKIIKKFVNPQKGGSIYIIKLNQQDQKSHGRNIRQWAIDLSQNLLKEHTQYYEEEVLLFPGFQFVVTNEQKDEKFDRITIQQSKDIGVQNIEDNDQFFLGLTQFFEQF